MRFFAKSADLKLVFSVPIRDARRWRGISLGGIEIASLNNLREESGVDGLTWLPMFPGDLGLDP